jgi:hypothetical protein
VNINKEHVQNKNFENIFLEQILRSSLRTSRCCNIHDNIYVKPATT